MPRKKGEDHRTPKATQTVTYSLIAVVLIIGVARIHWIRNYHKPHIQPTNQSAQKYTPGDEAPQSPVPTYESQAQYHVPILMYHYIRTVTDPHDRLGFNLSVTPQNFTDQVSWLKAAGYQTEKLDNLCQGKIPVSGKTIILTFDDGYDDAYTAAMPILKQYQFSGTFFIVTHFLNRPNYLTSTQVQSMQNEGMEIGAHTMDHIDLATATPAKQRDEISGSKQSSPVFAYPAGKYTATTISLVQQAGFRCAVTTNFGVATDHSPLFELPRVRISGGDTLAEFEKKVAGKI